MVDPIRAAALASAPQPSTDRAGAAGSPDLRESFLDALEDAAGSERQAEELAGRFADGDPSVGLHEVMIASGKANVAVRFAVTLKNRAIEAYRELMRTSV